MNPTFSNELRAKLRDIPSGKFEKFSITRIGLSQIFPKLLGIARKERGFTGEDLTSHDCAALFQGRVWTDAGWSVEIDEKKQFHPVEKFSEHFSDKLPGRMGSYTWAKFRLIKDMPLFLDAYEKVAVPCANGETTYWFDVLISDQNSSDITRSLGIADGLYSEAERHTAWLCGGMLTRAWCISEIVTRLLAVLNALGLWIKGQDNTDAIIVGGEHIRAGHPAFTTFVTVQGLTDFDRDLFAKDERGNKSVDYFAGMQAFDKGDLAAIKKRILAMLGSAEALNFAMIVVRNAILLRHADQHRVRIVLACFRSVASVRSSSCAAAAPWPIRVRAHAHHGAPSPLPWSALPMERLPLCAIHLHRAPSSLKAIGTHARDRGGSALDAPRAGGRPSALLADGARSGRARAAWREGMGAGESEYGGGGLGAERGQDVEAQVRPCPAPLPPAP